MPRKHTSLCKLLPVSSHGTWPFKMPLEWKCRWPAYSLHSALGAKPSPPTQKDQGKEGNYCDIPSLHLMVYQYLSYQYMVLVFWLLRDFRFWMDFVFLMITPITFRPLH
jgi:hypothetical protein